MFNFLESLADYWSFLRHGECLGSLVAVTQARRDDGLTVQRDTIAAGINCRVKIAEKTVEIGDNVFDIDDNTMIVVTEFSGGLLGSPSHQIYTLTFAEES